MTPHGATTTRGENYVDAANGTPQRWEIVRLTEGQGKTLRSIEISQPGEALNLDIHFEDNTMLELFLRTGFRASATLIEDRDGTLEILKRGDLGQVPED